MNRRSFFSSLAKCAAAAVIAPNIIASVRPDRMRWRKATPDARLYSRPNPDYITAPYEVAFWGSPSALAVLMCPPGTPFPPNMGNEIRSIVFKREPAINNRSNLMPPGYVVDPYPIRLDANGKVVPPIV